MSTSVDRARVSADMPGTTPLSVRAPDVDVPGMMADRIGDLWAAEERVRRNRRTERMILRAQSAK